MQLNTPLHRLRRQCPVEELDARREATLRGDCSGDLCCELTDSLLLELSEKLQMPPAPGHKPRPLVSPEKLMNSLQVLAFLRDVARLEVRAVSWTAAPASRAPSSLSSSMRRTAWLITATTSGLSTC